MTDANVVGHTYVAQNSGDEIYTSLTPSYHSVFYVQTNLNGEACGHPSPNLVTFVCTKITQTSQLSQTEFSENSGSRP